jgi:hypothetical protein
MAIEDFPRYRLTFVPSPVHRTADLADRGHQRSRLVARSDGELQ